MNDNNRNNPSYASLKGAHRAIPIVLFGIAVFCTLCFLISDIGDFGRAIRSILFGLFANGAYFIPVLICLHAIFYPSDLAEKKIASRFLFSFVSLVMISSFCYSIKFWNADGEFDVATYYALGKEGIGGGAIGSTVAYVTVKVFGSVGLIIIALTILAIYISYFFASGKKTWSKIFFGILKAIVIACALVERAIKRFVNYLKNRKRNQRIERHNRLNRELSDDEFFDVDNGMQSLSIDKLGIAQSKIIDGQTITLHDKVFHKSSIPADEYFTANDEVEIAEVKEAAEEVHEEAPQQFTQRRKVVHTDFDLGDAPLPSSISNQPKRNAADIIMEQVEEINQVSNVNFSYEKSADDVFTKDFDPFKMMMSDDLANKPSSKAVSQSRVIQGFTYSEKLRELTEEDVERARKVREFETRKQMIINQAKQATPVNNNGEYSGATKSVEFKESTSVPFSNSIKEDHSSVSLTIDKNSNDIAVTSRSAESYVVDRSDVEYRDTYVKTPQSSAYTPSSYQLAYSSEPRKVVNPTSVENSYSDSRACGYTEPTNSNSLHIQHHEINEVPSIQPSATSVTSSNDGLVFEFGGVESAEQPKVAESLFDEEYRDDSYVSTSSIEELKVVTDTTEPALHTESINIERTIITDNVSDDEGEIDINESFDSFTDANDDDTFEIDDEYTAEPDDDDAELMPQDESMEDDIGDAEEIPESEQNDDVKGYRNMFTFLKNEDKNNFGDEPTHAVEESCIDVNENDAQESNVTEEESAQIEEPVSDAAPENEDAEESDDNPPFEIDDTNNYHAQTVNSVPSAIADLVESVEPEVVTEQPKKKADYSNFRFPPIDLLGLDEEMDDEEITEEINENTKILIETLQSFNVTASIKGVDRGPRITRYEVVPAKGVKVNQITNLFDDIALNLAAEGIRMEAPIPGKSAIGFEIPNKRSSNVRLRELLECEKFINATSTTFVCIGKDVAGTPVFADIEKFPHCLVAGATGMGKSVCINSILISLLYKARPDEVKFIMIDPKKVEFKMYSGIPHLLIPVITDSKQAAGALMWAVEEMERRYDLIEAMNVRNLGMYNERVEENPSIGQKLPKIIIVIDELNDLMMQVREPCEDLIMRIAQKARAAGIHLIIGTQRPDAKVITGTIKANINTRIACKVGSQIDSRTILDNKGAEKLLNKGDMLYKPVDKTKPIRVQGAFVSDSEVESIMDFLKATDYGEQYDNDVINEITKAAQKCGNKKAQAAGYEDDGGDDEEIGYYNDQKFLDAVELAIRSGKIATSLLQRKLSIGYGKAAKYIDAMEEIGVVSEPNGTKPREVLITLDEWHEKLSRVGFDD